MKLFDVFIERIDNVNLYVRSLGDDVAELVKEAHVANITISSLANRLGVKQNVIYQWKKQGIPMSKLEALNKIFLDILKRPIDKNKILLGIEKSHHSISIPELNEELAYLVGYLSGDGSLLSYKGDLRVEFDDISKDFLEYISELVSNLFKIKKVKPVKDNVYNCYSLRFNSLLLTLFFHKVFELPVGKKKGILHIPESIEKSRFIKNFIAGFFDAEGSIHYTSKGGYQIIFSQKDRRFLEELKPLIESLGISITSIKDDRIVITKKENFIKLISILKLRHPDKTSRIDLAIKEKSTVRTSRISIIKQKIIEELMSRPQTSKELAQKLNRKRRTVWRHLRELERLGEVKGKRIKQHTEVIWDI